MIEKTGFPCLIGGRSARPGDGVGSFLGSVGRRRDRLLFQRVIRVCWGMWLCWLLVMIVYFGYLVLEGFWQWWFYIWEWYDRVFWFYDTGGILTMILTILIQWFGNYFRILRITHFEFWLECCRLVNALAVPDRSVTPTWSLRIAQSIVKTGLSPAHPKTPLLELAHDE